VNHVRSPKAREEGLPEDHGERAATSGDPLDGVLDQEVRDVLEGALALLPAEQRAVFVLRAMEDMSYKEIAEALGLSMGTVMSRLFRARERLAESLAPYLGSAALRAQGAGR
jgi:RNA polymerase sigma-70 factor, ECF subfamily